MPGEEELDPVTPFNEEEAIHNLIVPLEED